MKTKKFIVFGLVIFLLLLILLGLFIYKKVGNKNGNSGYNVEKVKTGNLVQIVSANGTLNPVVLVNVGTQVSGTVEKIYADFNSHVKEGQVLLELDPKLFKAEVLKCLAEVTKAKSTLIWATSQEKRARILHQTNNISQQDLEKIIEIRQTAAADLELARALLAKAKTNLDYATIHSPVPGVVVDRQVDVGQTVAASFQTPTLFTIAQDLSKMQINTSFAEADIGSIRPNQEVSFTVDAFPDSSFKGMVKQIRLNPTTQQNVVTYNVVIEVNNPEEILLPGMTAYVNITIAEHKNVLLVPNTAFRFSPEGAKFSQTDTPGHGTFYKLKNGKIEAVSCRLGISDNRFTEVITDKIKVGDDVILNDLKANSPTQSKSFRMKAF